MYILYRYLDPLERQVGLYLAAAVVFGASMQLAKEDQDLPHEPLNLAAVLKAEPPKT